jgi:hypothetical protein
MDVTRVGKRRGFTSMRLLIAAAVAFAMALVGVRIYPHLVSDGTHSTVLAGLRAVVVICLLATFVLPWPRSFGALPADSCGRDRCRLLTFGKVTLRMILERIERALTLAPARNFW